MGKGIKVSKNMIFNVNYEMWPNSGPSTKDDSDDYYIVGVGTDSLPEAYHDPVEAAEVGYEVPVYLESELSKSPTGNKKLEGGKFSEPITRISEDEFDDLNLMAKGSQYLWKGSTSFSESADQGGIKVEKGNLLFQGKR